MSWDIFSKSKIQYFLQKLKDKFVQKETGKGLSTNDYTTTDKNKVATIGNKADKVSSATNGNLAGLNGSGNLTDSGWNGAKDTTSISGNPISISGLKSNQLAGNPIITFEPIQAGSGTPSPSNIRATSGYDKIEVLSCGKNIFNGEVIQGRWSHTDGTWVEQATFWATKNPIPVIGGQSNYISNAVYRAYYDKNMTFISGDGTGNAVVTTPANAVWMHITQAKADWSSPSTTMVAMSNTAITYVPYHKTTDLSESLGQTVYGGTLDVRTGVFTVTHQIIDLGDVTWTYDSTNVRFSAIGALPNASAYWTLVNWYCSCFEATSSAYADADRTYGVITLNQISIFVRDNRYTDATAFKTAVTGQKLVYPLATPVEIQLTPHEISLLKDYAYVSTNGTNIALDYHNGELASLSDVAQLGETVNELGDVLLNNVIDISNKIVMTDPDRQQNVKAYQYGKVIFISLYTGKVTSANTNITIGSIDSSIRAGVNVPGHLGLASSSDFGYGSINIGASGSIVLIYSKTTSYNLYATFTYVTP